VSGKQLRIAAFGFRSIPPCEGCAGADTFVLNLYPRLIQKGYIVNAYNRDYGSSKPRIKKYKNINLMYIRTINKKGFDTLIHSFLSTLHIIINNTGDIIHIQNGGNSIWAFFLKLFGKKVYISQDGIDWKRDKWPWYGKLYLYISSYITANIPDGVIFDNIYAKELFRERFKKQLNKFHFVPFGSEVTNSENNSNILITLNLNIQEYFIFVGRFIPDKGLQYLIPAFEKIKTNKKLILVGGSPNPSDFERIIKSTKDKRIIFPGYIYGEDVYSLIKNAYAYIQPSDIEGLSPVILQSMWLGTPIICSDIKENIYAVGNEALFFRKGDITSLYDQISFSLKNPLVIKSISLQAQKRASSMFSWNRVCNDHERIFNI